MCHEQSLRSDAQSDQSLCLSLEYSMTPRLLTEQHLEFLSLQEAAQAPLHLHLSKCCIVGNHNHVMAPLYDQHTRFWYLSYWKAVKAVVRLCQCIHKVGKVERSGSVGIALDRGLKGC